LATLIQITEQAISTIKQIHIENKF